MPLACESLVTITLKQGQEQIKVTRYRTVDVHNCRILSVHMDKGIKQSCFKFAIQFLLHDVFGNETVPVCWENRLVISAFDHSLLI